MSKQDYVVIADAMAGMINSGYIKKKDIGSAINDMVSALSRDNWKFDTKIFKIHIVNRI